MNMRGLELFVDATNRRTGGTVTKPFVSSQMPRDSTRPSAPSASQICRRCSLPLSECKHPTRWRDTLASNALPTPEGSVDGAATKRKRHCRKCPGRPLRSQCQHTRAGQQHLRVIGSAQYLREICHLNEDEIVRILEGVAGSNFPAHLLPEGSSSLGSLIEPFDGRCPSSGSPDNQSSSSELSEGQPPTSLPLVSNPSDGQSRLTDPLRNGPLLSNSSVILNIPQGSIQASASTYIPHPSSNSTATPLVVEIPYSSLDQIHTPPLQQTSKDIPPPLQQSSPAGPQEDAMQIDDDSSDLSDSEPSRPASPTLPPASFQFMDIHPALIAPIKLPAPPTTVDPERGTDEAPLLPYSDELDPSAESTVRESSQVSKDGKVQTKKADSKHGYVYGAMRGSKEHRVIRKHKRPLPVEDGRAASKRFLEQMNRLVVRADDLAASTSSWIFVAGQHCSASGPFIHYTSPRLLLEASDEMNSIINQINRIMTHLVHSHRSDALTLFNQLKKAREEKQALQDKVDKEDREKERLLAEKEGMQRLLTEYRERLGLDHP